MFHGAVNYLKAEYQIRVSEYGVNSSYTASSHLTPPIYTLHGGVVSLLHKIYREKMTESTRFYVF